MFLLHLLGASAITSTSNTSISLTISKSLAWVKTPCCTWGHARYKKSNLELSWISSDQQQATPTRWPEGKQKDETKCLSRNRKQKQKSKKKNKKKTWASHFYLDLLQPQTNWDSSTSVWKHKQNQPR